VIAEPPSLDGGVQLTVTDALPRTDVPIVGAVGATATPVPDTATVRGAPEELLAMFTVADKAPAAFGANLTATTHEAPCARAVQPAAGVAVNEAALAPVTVTPVTFSVATPAFSTVMFRTADCAPTLVVFGKAIEVGVTVAGAAIAAAAFAFASYAPLRALVAVGLVGALGQGVLLAADVSGVGRTWGSAVAAVTIGAVCHLVAGLFRVPPLVVVVPAIVPLLPGLEIYRGLALLAEGKDGVLQLASALATALALAAGVILGQYIARPIKREAHRLESRLSGPRMVGALRRRGANQR